MVFFLTAQAFEISDHPIKVIFISDAFFRVFICSVILKPLELIIYSTRQDLHLWTSDTRSDPHFRTTRPTHYLSQ